MQATLTQLRRQATKSLPPARHSRKVTITKRERPVAEIVPVTNKERAAALAALRAIGPIPFKPRK